MPARSQKTLECKDEGSEGVMNQVVSTQNNVTTTPNLGRIEQVLIGGDLSLLSEMERVTYYKTVCQTLALNPLTKPFEYIKLNGKLVLYATKACTDQLRQTQRVSVRVTARETIEGVYVVTAHAKLPDGREDESTGAVPIQGLKGEYLANAMMKAETKAKRRVTLSVCGLGMLDETEVESIPGAKPGQIIPEQPSAQDGAGVDRGYRIPFGKFAQRTLEEIDTRELGSYVDYIERKAEKDGKPLTGPVLDFVQRATAYLTALEAGASDEAHNAQDGSL